MARFAYRNSIQSWYEATVQQPAFIEYLRAAEEDFSEFAKNDPVYIELLKIVKPLTDPTAHGGAAEDAFHLGRCRTDVAGGNRDDGVDVCAGARAAR